MSVKEQNEQEQKDLSLFLSLNSLEYLSYDIELESPDCDIKTKKGTVGLEITEFVRNEKVNSIQRSVNDTLEGINRDVESEVKKITDKKITINYSRQSFPIPKIKSKSRKELVAFLVNHIKKKEVLEKLNEESFRIEFQYLKHENQFIKSVRISTYPEKESLTISENKSYFTDLVPKEYIESIITKKDAKMDFTRNNETWLLIVLAEEEYSSGIIDSTVLNYPIDSLRFERIYLLERFSKSLYELNLCV